jgi:hypothetical protein
MLYVHGLRKIYCYVKVVIYARKGCSSIRKLKDYYLEMMRMDKNKLRKVKILHGKFKGNVGYFHGFFQYGDEDSQAPYAVIELESGHVVDIQTENIQFINEIDDSGLKTNKWGRAEIV